MIGTIKTKIRSLFSKGTDDAAPSSPLPAPADGKPQGQSLSAQPAAPVQAPVISHAPAADAADDKQEAAGGGKRTFE
ncbi:MAG TPA: hypothetical protein VNP95_02640 [Thermomicrobiales bacterium]|nr:hypothetical protein [Thermomicrobiales bacterium]